MVGPYPIKISFSNEHLSLSLFGARLETNFNHKRPTGGVEKNPKYSVGFCRKFITLDNKITILR